MEIKHFLLCPEGDTENKKLCFFDRPLKEGLRKVINLWDGVKVAHEWPKDARLLLGASCKGRKLESVLGNDQDVLMVNAEMKQAIAECCKDTEVEYLPFVLCDSKGKEISRDYYVVNPVGTYDGMDFATSDISWDREGRILTVEEAVLDKKRAAASPPLFRLGHAPRKIIIDITLARALYDRQFGNIYWIELRYNDTQEMYQRAERLHIPHNATYQQMQVTHQFINAVRMEERAEAEMLLRKKPFLNMSSQENGPTALMHLAQKGHDGLLQVLLKAGADPDIRDAEGQTALYFSVLRQSEPCVRALLGAGANPDLPRVDSREPEKIISTPLEHAVYLQDKKIVKLLLQYKADPNLKDHNGKIAFHVAKDHDLRVLLFEAGTDVNANSEYFSSPFHITAGTGPLSLLQKMFNKGGLVNAADRYDKSTPLMNAARHGQLDCVRFLVEKGAGVQAKDSSGKTAIQYAFEEKHLEVVAYLTKQGAVTTKAMSQRIQQLQKKRTELAFDQYAEEVAAHIHNVIRQSAGKIKFEPLALQINCTNNGELQWFVIKGKTEKQAFEYHFSPEADTPVPYNKDEIRKLTGPFLKRYQLKEKDVDVALLLHWQLYEKLTALSLKPGKGIVPVMLVVDDYTVFEDKSTVSRRVQAGLSKPGKKDGAIEALAALCLAGKQEQRRLVSLISNIATTYAMDNIAASITKSAITTILQHRKELKAPIKTVKLLFDNFGYLFPSNVELRFTKGKPVCFSIDVPGSPIPRHIDDFVEEDYLLQQFITTHKLKKGYFEWGDLFRLPQSVYWVQLMEAARNIAGQLRKHGVACTEDIQACIGDGEEDSDDIAGYISLIQQEIRKKLSNKALKKAFADLCFTSATRRQWFLDIEKLEVDASNSWVGH